MGQNAVPRHRESSNVISEHAIHISVLYNLTNWLNRVRFRSEGGGRGSNSSGRTSTAKILPVCTRNTSLEIGSQGSFLPRLAFRWTAFPELPGCFCTLIVSAACCRWTLDFAERGSIALSAQDRGSVDGFDSPFEEAVAAQLQAFGWQIVSHVGISGFRVDLGIRHPDLPGAYLVGVECDGATYHSSATARDRDKGREQLLRGLGWNIVRVWSTDWWFDLPGCVQRLHESLNTLRDDSRRQRAEQKTAGSVPTETMRWDMAREVETIEPIAEPAPPPEVFASPPPPSRSWNWSPCSTVCHNRHLRRPCPYWRRLPPRRLKPLRPGVIASPIFRASAPIVSSSMTSLTAIHSRQWSMPWSRRKRPCLKTCWPSASPAPMAGCAPLAEYASVSACICAIWTKRWSRAALSSGARTALPTCWIIARPSMPTAVAPSPIFRLPNWQPS